jgi:predicted nucleotidyltransferase
MIKTMEKIEPKNDLHKEFLDVIYDLVNDKIKNEPIVLVVLGGSVARGDMEEHSDIDIVFYVPKNDLEKYSRGFYKYHGKFIEDSYFAIEDLNMSDLIAESMPIYDPENRLGDWMGKSADEENLSNIFRQNIEIGKKILFETEDNFNKGFYKESLVNLLTMNSYVFILLHSLPPRFNLPFPTFKLYKSIEEISNKLNSPKIYELSTKLYSASPNFIDIFEESYKIMYGIQKKINPNQSNYGFFDPLKIEYNIKYAKDVVKKYPEFYASRFAMGCVIDWAWGNVDDAVQLEATEKYKDKLDSLALEILGTKKISKEFVEEKLKISKELSGIIDELIEKDLI